MGWNLLFWVNDSSKVRRMRKELEMVPEKRETCELFGKRAIGGAVSCLIFGLIGLVFAVIVHIILQSYEMDLAVGFVFFGTLLLILLALYLVLYPLLLHIRYFRYGRYQRQTNDLPIGKKARIISIIFLLINLVLVVIVPVVMLSGL